MRRSVVGWFLIGVGVFYGPVIVYLIFFFVALLGPVFEATLDMSGGNQIATLILSLIPDHIMGIIVAIVVKKEFLRPLEPHGEGRLRDASGGGSWL